MPHRYDAVLFDLLSALLDSWSLWDDVAGDSALGRAWRMHYLTATSHAKRYEPYVALIAESASAVGLPKSRAEILAERWCELTPWPEVKDVLSELAFKTKIGVVTNCSEELGLEAASKIGVNFDVVLTAERAGYYKPDPRIYEMAISAIGAAPDRILYVAGSPFDVCGAAAVGMPVYWHNRTGLPAPEANSSATVSADSLLGLRDLVC